MKSVFSMAVNIAGKGENDSYKHFLFLLQYF